MKSGLIGEDVMNGQKVMMLKYVEPFVRDGFAEFILERKRKK